MNIPAREWISVSRSVALRDQERVSLDVANAVHKLTESLKAEFGSDFSFQILGRGHYVAASNLDVGIIPPLVSDREAMPKAKETCKHLTPSEIQPEEK